MMYILNGNTREGCNNKWIGWHTGEPFPSSIKERVVTFQADGQELEILLTAIRNASKKE